MFTDRYPASTVSSCYHDKRSWHQHFLNVHFAVHLQKPPTLSSTFLHLRSLYLPCLRMCYCVGFGRFGAFALLPALPSVVLRDCPVWPLSCLSIFALSVSLAGTTENEETKTQPIGCALCKRAAVTLKTALSCFEAWHQHTNVA